MAIASRAGEGGKGSWAYVVLPGLLLLAVYVLFVRPRFVSTLEQSRSRLEATRSQMPSPAAMNDLLQRIAARRQQIEEERALRRPISAPEEVAAEGADLKLTAWRSEVSRTLARHDLLLLDESVSDLDVDPGVGRHARSSKPVGKLRRVQAWTLVLTGSYLDVLGALEELERSGMRAAVLQLERHESKEAGEPTKWTLVIA